MPYRKFSWWILFFALIINSANVRSANWLRLQGTEPQSTNTDVRLWGFLQPTYQKDYSHSTAPEPTRIGPNLETQEQFQLYRARIGIRGIVKNDPAKQADGLTNYFSLFEFGHNGATDGGSLGERTPVRMMDFSVTLNYIPYARIRFGLFKTPGSEELFQGLATYEYINFSWVGNQLMLERFAPGVSVGNGDGSVDPAGSEYGSYDSSFGAARDTGVQLFDWVTQGYWTHSYALMIGNGNGLEPASGLAKGMDRYVYWSSEKQFAKGKGPRVSGWKLYLWSHTGKQHFITSDFSLGADSPEIIRRSRQGTGTVYRQMPWRFSAEYITGKGMIFQGPEKPGFNIGPYECINGKTKGFHLDAGYYIPVSKWNLDLRYDHYTRCDGHAQIEARFDNTTLGVQYRFSPRSKLTINYEIRSAKATGSMPFISLVNGLDVIANRLGVQMTSIF